MKNPSCPFFFSCFNLFICFHFDVPQCLQQFSPLHFIFVNFTLFSTTCFCAFVFLVFMSCLRCSFSRRPRMSPTCRRRTKRLANCSSLRQPSSCPSSCQCLFRFLHGVRPLPLFFSILLLQAEIHTNSGSVSRFLLALQCGSYFLAFQTLLSLPPKFNVKEVVVVVVMVLKLGRLLC